MQLFKIINTAAIIVICCISNISFGQSKFNYLLSTSTDYSGQSVYKELFSINNGSTYLMPYNRLLIDHPVFNLNGNGISYNANFCMLYKNVGFELSGFQTNRKMIVVDETVIKKFTPFVIKQYGIKCGFVFKLDTFAKGKAFFTISPSLGYHYAKSPRLSYYQVMQDSFSGGQIEAPINYDAIYYAGFQKSIAFNLYYLLMAFKCNKLWAMASFKGTMGGIAIQNTAFSRSDLHTNSFNVGLGLGYSF